MNDELRPCQHPALLWHLGRVGSPQGFVAGAVSAPRWLLDKEEEAEKSLRNQVFQGAVEGETNQSREFTVFAIWSVFFGQKKINVSPALHLAGFPSTEEYQNGWSPR